MPRTVRPDATTALYIPLPADLRPAMERAAPDVLITVGQNGLMLGDQGKLWVPPPPTASAPDAEAATALTTPPGSSSTRTLKNGLGSPGAPPNEAALVIAAVVVVVATVVLTVWAAQQGYEEYNYYMADRALIPIRAHLKEQGLGEELRAAFDEQGRTTPGLNAGQATLLRAPGPETIRIHMAESKAPGTLSVGINYMMSPDLKRLQIVAEARVTPHSERWRSALLNRNDAWASRVRETTGGPGDTLYRRVIYLNTRLPDSVSGRSEAASAWLGKDGEPIRAALREGARLLAMGIADDLSRDAESASQDRKLRLGERTFDLRSGAQSVLHLHTTLDELLPTSRSTPLP